MEVLRIRYDRPLRLEASGVWTPVLDERDIAFLPAATTFKRSDIPHANENVPRENPAPKAHEFLVTAAPIYCDGDCLAPLI